MVVVPHRAQPGRTRHLQLLVQPQPRPVAGRERRQPVGRAAVAAPGRRRRALGVRHGAVHLPGGGVRRRRRLGVRGAGAAADPPGGGGARDRRARSRPRHGPPPHEGALVGGLRPLRRHAHRACRPDRRRLQDVLRARARPGRPRGRLHEHRLRRPPRLRAPRSVPSRPRPGRIRRRAGAGLPGRRPGLRRADRRGPRALRRGADRDHHVRSRHEADLLDVPRQRVAAAGRAPALPAPLAPAVPARAGCASWRWPTAAWRARRPGTGRLLDLVPLAPAAAG